MRRSTFISALFAAALAASPAAAGGTAGAPVPGAAALELVMVESPGCAWCARWREEIGPIYPKTAEGRSAPLRTVDLASAELHDMALDPPLTYTPTFVLMQDGREVGRIVGYPGEAFFWGLLDRMLADAGRDVSG